MKKRMILICITMLLLCGCGKKMGENVSIDMPTSAETMEVPVLDKIPIPETQNLLTGVADLSKEAIGKRPVAVMINNVEPALPQYGIGQADVIFELPVEGDQTRIMALYADYTKVPDVCSVRSCRYYFPAIANGFDAFYIHWGAAQTILGYVDSIGVDRYDGISNPGGLFARDSQRKSAGYSLEHTGYFKGTDFASVVQNDGSRIELKDAKKDTAFSFCEMGTIVTPEGDDCSYAQVKFGASTTVFKYNADENVYYKEMNGHTHIDGKTKEQLSFTNVFLLETSISVRDDVGHKQINWKGSSTSNGYYISNGKVQKIHWSQKDENSYLKFYDENGNELLLNRGKTYVGYTYENRITL